MVLTDKKSKYDFVTLLLFSLGGPLMAHNDFQEKIPLPILVFNREAKFSTRQEHAFTKTHEHKWHCVLELGKTSQILALTTDLVNNAKTKCYSNPNYTSVMRGACTQGGSARLLPQNSITQLSRQAKH